MKKIIFSTVILFCYLCSMSQNVGIGTTTPNAGAILDLNSNSKALLLPRLTTSQRNAISNPIGGMLIYNLDSNRFEGCIQSLNYTSTYNLVDSSTSYSGISYPCCVNGYVQYNPSSNVALRKIQLLLSNATGSPQTLQIGFGDFGSNPIMGTASAVVPANTPTAIPIDFIFPTNLNLTQFASYKIYVAVDNQNVQWKGTTGSAFTSICGNSGFSLGLAYKTFSFFDSGLIDEASSFSNISYPCCVNGYVQYNPTSSFSLYKIQLLLSNATTNAQTLQINLVNIGGNTIMGTASAIVPANTSTAVPIDFIFSPNISLTQFTSYKIAVAVDNQNVQWKGTAGSAFTSICNNSGFNIGLAYKTYTSIPPTTNWVKLNQ